MITLRKYQEKALEFISRYFKTKTGNPIVAMPTGTGKSLVIGALIKYAMSFRLPQRVLVLTHVKELIEQNRERALDIYPDIDLGIYSAGLKQRETSNAVIFAGIASVYKRAEELGSFDLILIDECHLVSDTADTMYQSFIEKQKEMNPRLKVIGFSATPYRLRSGLLTNGNIFTDVCYDITGLKAFNQLVRDGYIAPLITQETEAELDIGCVGTRAGEFIAGQLQDAVDKLDVTERSVSEMINKGAKRKHWLVFAAGVNHCESVAAALNNFGVKAVYVHSKITREQRDENIAAFKAGTVRAIVNNNILTTGFDFPNIDLIAVLRPTLSPGLWVQMLGRGTRIADEKKNCLVLDFSGNTKRLGPINDVMLPNWGSRKRTGERLAPVKVCEHCSTINHASVRLCALCGAVFPVNIAISPTADTRTVLAKDKVETKRLKVDSVRYSKHSKKNKNPSLKITYKCGLNFYREWVCLEHSGYPKQKAIEWWTRRTQQEIPETIDAALTLTQTLREPEHIDVAINKKYPEILRFFFR